MDPFSLQDYCRQARGDWACHWNGLPEPRATMGCSLLDCAKCCSIFSLAGLIFLLIIGSLLQNQPLYIKGPKDGASSAQSCYQGALIYLGTFVASVAYWIFDSLKKKAAAALSGSGDRQRTQGSRQYGALASDAR